MPTKRPDGPEWERLYEVASSQDGYFTTSQATDAGYSSQLLAHHVRSGGRFVRVVRGVYRIVHYPVTEHDSLVIAWLWSEHVGVVSHETALMVHGLSDALPSRVHLTLPAAWSKRRLRIPRGIQLSFADMRPEEREWFGPVPVTTPLRTVHDCRDAHVAPDVLEQAERQGIRRGLFTKPELRTRNPRTRVA